MIRIDYEKGVRVLVDGTDEELAELDRDFHRVGDGEWSINPKKMRGAGDLLGKVLDPIANALGVDKASCGCEGRKAWINNKVPFK